MARKRERWRQHQGRLDPRRLVFLDETWAKTNMTRLRGWAPRGHKLVDNVPHGHWRTLTFVAALRHDRIDAPLVLDGPINGASFTAYVEQFLTPTLSSGDIVIMDNLGSHKGPAVRGDPTRRRPSAVPAALQPRPESDRTGLRQAQDLTPKGRRALCRCDMEAHRHLARRFPTAGMRQLPQKFRLRFNVDGSDTRRRGCDYHGRRAPNVRVPRISASKPTVAKVPILAIGQ